MAAARKYYEAGVKPDYKAGDELFYVDRNLSPLKLWTNTKVEVKRKKKCKSRMIAGPNDYPNPWLKNPYGPYTKGVWMYEISWPDEELAGPNGWVVKEDQLARVPTLVDMYDSESDDDFGGGGGGGGGGGAHLHLASLHTQMR